MDLGLQGKKAIVTGGNSGIGLAMAQHIVAAHRGRILVESEPGRGSTFTIVIGRSPTCAS